MQRPSMSPPAPGYPAVFGPPDPAANDNGPVFDPRDPHGDGKRRYAWQDDDEDAFASPAVTTTAPPPSMPARPRMRQLKVSFPPAVLDRLQAASDRTGVSVNDLIRETVRARFGPA